MKKLFFTLFLLFSSFSLQAEIKVHQLFSKGAVLQRNQAVPVWGWAKPGSKISVSFAGQKESSQTNSTGKWMVTLKSMPASSDSRSMTISDGETTLSIDDILVGEVWLCSGQSNMDFGLGGVCRKPRNPKYQAITDFMNEEIKDINDTLFRQMTVRRELSPLNEKENIVGTWYPANQRFVKGFTAVGFNFGRELRKELNIPVGLIKCAWGGTRVEAWIPTAQYQSDNELKEYYDAEIAKLNQTLSTWDKEKVAAENKAKIEAHKIAAEKANVEGKKRPHYPRLQKNPDENNTLPSTLYNAMIAPLVPYAMKGAIWYQGEANAGFATDQYQKRFTKMIQGWRQAWDLPLDFYWCQLAQFKKPLLEPAEASTWVQIQYQQSQCMSLPNSGMAVLNDIGDAADIHPINKIDAGKRLAFWALNKSYKKEDVIHSGPTYKSHEVKANKVIITFDNTGSGLMTASKELHKAVQENSSPLKSFQICAADGAWQWAEAKIISSNQVEVSHAEISQPVEVRYAWASNPEGANLYNKEGLPTGLFKTEL
ncbi:sialate O-acetylesterase [Lentisphaera profundi]|uniref:Sialate O-acetylesterase n=1 Tax=Lentisphaera profundi TaxID=1658616 RepID=A0ABY7VTJ8_9BACT|nr:sialate O-acetylesterase [Lentisphaera profundi]WDE96550.1 sialate O-acetylesterase [Lentisphaera profundi]